MELAVRGARGYVESWGEACPHHGEAADKGLLSVIR